MLIGEIHDLPVARPVNPYRLDLMRGMLLFGALIATIGSGMHVATRGDSVTRSGEFIFGQSSRIGSILFMPAYGDACRQAAFDNDSGLVVGLGDKSCYEALNVPDPRFKPESEPDRFATISEKFRK